jgi:phosphate uptake regulator
LSKENVEKLNEEQRKLQVTGGSTFILSLPKEWATKNELKRGSSMIVREEEDGSLSIAPSNFPKKEKQDEAFIKASINDNPDAIMRTAISAYLDGFNILHIRAQGQKVLSSKLRNHLKTFPELYLVGTEIVIDTPSERPSRFYSTIRN